MLTPPPTANHSDNSQRIAPVKNAGEGLRHLCDALWARISAFLEEENDDEEPIKVADGDADAKRPDLTQAPDQHREFVKRARAQTRISLGVIEEALHRYRYSYPPTAYYEIRSERR